MLQARLISSHLAGFMEHPERPTSGHHFATQRIRSGGKGRGGVETQRLYLCYTNTACPCGVTPYAQNITHLELDDS